MRRLLSLAVGVLFLGLLFWLGLRVSHHPSSANLVWFGLACTILSPLGLGLLNYTVFGSDRSIVKRLSDVAEMKEVIEKATSEKQQLQALQKEREQLDAFVRYEAERMALESRRAALESDGLRILGELEHVEAEQRQLRVKTPDGVAVAQLAELRERLRASSREQLVLSFGGRGVVIPKQAFVSVPFYGLLTYYLLSWYAEVLRDMASRRARRRRDRVRKAAGN
jgi:hypothetical protein